MSKYKNLKAFVRYDGGNDIVPGSLVLRKTKPKNGRWKEIDKSLCCNGATLTNVGILDPFPWNFTACVVYCTTGNQFIYLNTGIIANNLSEVVDALNSNASNIGVFSLTPDGTNVQVSLNSSTSQSFSGCPIGDINFQTFED